MPLISSSRVVVCNLEYARMIKISSDYRLAHVANHLKKVE